MKKLIISITLLFCGLIIYGQIPAPTTPQTLNNGEQMLIIRTKTNTNFTNIGAYAARLKDTLNAHNIRLLALEDSSMSFATRLDVIEAGGVGGSSYTFSNGLTLSGTNARLGGTLLASTAINTNGSLFQIHSIGTIPTTGTYANFLFEDEQVSLGSRLLSSGLSFLTSGSYLELPSTGLMKLTSTISADVWSQIYQDATGLHFYYNGSPLGGEIVHMNGAGGLRYGGNYRIGFTQYSLVDKGYVDALIGSGGGTVTTSGTPLTNQLAFYSSSSAITGSNFITRNAYGGLALTTTTGSSLIITPPDQTTGLSIDMATSTTTALNITNNYDDVFSIVGDSTFLSKFADWTVRPWVTIQNTGAIDTAHVTNAGERLYTKISPLVFHLYDRKIINGVPEISWYHSNGIKEYGINHLDPWKQVEALMGNIEMLERWLFRTQVLVFILFITIGFLIRYLYKFNKRLLILENNV